MDNKTKEFDWLGGCVTCNMDCCHNTDKFLPEYDCSHPTKKKIYSYSNNHGNTSLDGTYDHRPLECRLFPFDIRDIDGKIMWIKWDDCHASPRLNYENFMDFFEKKFSKEISAEDIKSYIAYRKNSHEQPKTGGYEGHEGYSVIREVNWPNIL